MTARLDVAWSQIIGRRDYQQDEAAEVVAGDQRLLLLCDGMGGHVGGDLASSITVKSFSRAWRDPEAPKDVPARLANALQVANLAIHDRFQAEPALMGMGTTLVAVHVAMPQFHWLSVGDSPLWLFRDGALSRLNANHSVAAVLDDRARRGEISQAEALQSPDRSQLLEVVDGHDIELVDLPTTPCQLRPGDMLVLASDGVESCPTAELEILLDRHASCATAAAEAVLRAVEAHERTWQDNATLLVGRVPDHPERRTFT